VRKKGLRVKGQGLSGRGLIFVISGPSGSGKTTLARLLAKSGSLKGKLRKSVSLTTRPKRSGEVSGRDYRFVSEKIFLQQLRRKKILEWTRFLGYYYGTPKEFVDGELAKGMSLALCLDMKGARAIKRMYPQEAVTVFVLPPSLGELAVRIKGRCSRTHEREIRRRLTRARQELKQAGAYDHRVINRDLGRASRNLERIVLGYIGKK
jgi:guanylate kinase